MRGGGRDDSQTRTRGFTLLELSVVLFIIATVLGMGLLTFTASLQASQYNNTVARMDEIEKAILNYAIGFNRIPCPTDLTLTASSVSYGLEAGTTAGGTGAGECVTGMTPAANHKSSGGAEEGGVPTRALRLPDDYMYDGWGRKFRYAVDPTYTKSSALPVTAACGVSNPDASALTVNDASGAARTSAGMYVLMSHGANGHGAFTSNGVTTSSGTESANELTNCHCTSAGAYNGTYTPTYLEKAPAYDSGKTGNNLYYFDDIVSFKEPWQMQAPDFPLTAATCQYVYVADSGNSRIQIFSLTGAYVGQVSNSHLGGPTYLAVDSSGNVYVSDYANDEVEKFTSSGSYVTEWGGWSQIEYPSDIAIDPSGNVWVADEDNNRLDELSSSLSLVKQFSNDATSYTTGIAFAPNGNIWVGDVFPGQAIELNTGGTEVTTVGNGGGDWNQLYGITTDSAGDIWATDTYNNRVREFSTSNTLIATISGSGASQLNNPLDVKLDANGNVWIVDNSNNRIEKFSSSGTFLLGIGSGYQGAAGTIGSTGSGNGQFNNPQGIAIGNR